jgi:hypothetical protein
MASKHSSAVGGSTANLRLNCLKSIDESKRVPRQSSIYACVGTALHAVVEAAIDERLEDDEVVDRYEGIDIAQLLTEETDIEEFGHHILDRKTIVKKALPAIQYFYDTVVDTDYSECVLEKYMTFAARDDSPFGECFDIYDEATEEYGGGSPDTLFSSKDFAGIIDWKFGDGKLVNPENNSQLKFYLALAIHNGVLPVRKEYEAHIFQPAESLDKDDYGKCVIYSYEEIENFILDLRDAMESERVYIPGPHCAECRGKIACPEYKRFLTNTMSTDIEGLSNKELGHALNMVESLRKYAKDVEAAAFRNAVNGVTFAGWKIPEPLGNTAYRDEAAASAALGRLGIAAKERHIISTISASQALKLLDEKQVDKKQIERFKKKHTTRPELEAKKLVPAKPGEDANAFEAVARAMATR